MSSNTDTLHSVGAEASPETVEADALYSNREQILGELSFLNERLQELWTQINKSNSASKNSARKLTTKIRKLELKISSQEKEIISLKSQLAHAPVAQSESNITRAGPTPTSAGIITKLWNRHLKINAELVSKVNQYLEGTLHNVSLTPDQTTLLDKALQLSTLVEENPTIEAGSMIRLKHQLQTGFQEATEAYRVAKEIGPAKVRTYLAIFRLNVAVEHSRLKLAFAQQFLRGIARSSGPQTNSGEVTPIDELYLPSEDVIFNQLQSGTRSSARFSAFNALWHFRTLDEVVTAADSKPDEMVTPSLKPRVTTN